MEKVLIQINNNQAYNLLENLEALQLITVLHKDVQPQSKLSEKYKGVFSKEDAENFDKYIQTSRQEWDLI